eukprot:405641-Pelagomonas_calceolata.AAC.5
MQQPHRQHPSQGCQGPAQHRKSVRTPHKHICAVGGTTVRIRCREAGRWRAALPRSQRRQAILTSWHRSTHLPALVHKNEGCAALQSAQSSLLTGGFLVTTFT